MALFLLLIRCLRIYFLYIQEVTLNFHLMKGIFSNPRYKQYWKPEITNEITDIVEAENLISEALDKSIKEE